MITPSLRARAPLQPLPIEPETATESEYLDQIKDEMRALLVAKAGRPA